MPRLPLPLLSHHPHPHHPLLLHPPARCVRQANCAFALALLLQQASCSLALLPRQHHPHPHPHRPLLPLPPVRLPRQVRRSPLHLLHKCRFLPRLPHPDRPTPSSPPLPTHRGQQRGLLLGLISRPAPPCHPLQ